MGARNAGNPHAACDVEGTGNVARSSGLPARQSSTLPMSIFLGKDGNRNHEVNNFHRLFVIGHKPAVTFAKGNNHAWPMFG